MKVVPRRFAEAQTLVKALDHAANRELLIEVRNLWDVLVVGPVAAPAPRSDPLPTPTASARRIVELLNGTARPIGELIQDLNAGDPGGRVAMLLMAGMTGIFTATNTVREQLEEILRRAKSEEAGSLGWGHCLA